MVLNAKKAEVTASLQRNIEDPHRGYSCEYGASSMEAYFRELKRCSLWPSSEVFRQSSLSTIFHRILFFQESNTAPKSTYYSAPRTCYCRICQTQFQPFLENVRMTHLFTITGLCLDCVKAGRPEMKEGPRNCRISH